jgi:hypothetical protein
MINNNIIGKQEIESGITIKRVINELNVINNNREQNLKIQVNEPIKCSINFK